MRVFLAGASGVIGSHLLPLLVDAGHEVAGMTRTATKADALRAAGAEPVVCDVYDADGLVAVMRDFGPDLVMHQLTDLPDEQSALAGFTARNARIRTLGTRNLLAGARAAGATRIWAQSIAWVPVSGAASLEEFETMVLDTAGVVARYGAFYGPGTYYPGAVPPHPRIHVAEAARRSLDLLEHPGGIVVIAEPDPDASPAPGAAEDATRPPAPG